MSAAADASALCGTKRQAPGHPGSISRIPVGSKELVEDGVDTRHKGEVRELSLTPAKAARQVSDGGGPHITDIRSSSSSSMTGASMIKTIVHGLTTRSVPLKLSPSMPERVRKDVQAALAKQQQQHAAANGGGNSTGASGSVSTDTLLLRSVPTILLYDDAGLELFDQITYLEEYYLTNAEMDILRRHSAELVAAHVRDGSVLIELGVGSMRKTRFLLDAIAESGKQVTYYALDLCEEPLRAGLAELRHNYPSITFRGLQGTYDDCLAYIGQHMPSAPGQRLVLWLGSSIGNYTRPEAAAFLRSVRDAVLATGDLMLVGADRRNAKRKVELAYNEPAGVTAAFILNGLNHCNALLGGGGGNDHGDGDANGNGNGNGDGNAAGGAALDPSAFEYAAWYNVEEGRHEAYYRSVRDQTLTLRHEGRETVVTLAAGELIHIEYSYKYGSAEVAELVEVSGLTHVRQWSDAAEQYDLHLLRNDGGGDKQQQQKKKEDGENGASAAAASSNSNPAITAPPSAAMPSLWSTSGSHYVCDLGGVDPTNQRAPAFSEFLDLWNAWDCVSLRMVPAGRHDDRPIKLRMPLMFYIGHIPAFDDFLVAAYAGAPRLEPQEYARIFERGIDPDVDSLQVHHRHSKVPSAYPPLDDVLRYRDAVRCALQRLYASYPGGTSTMPRRLQRVLWAAIEHEVMHLETYVYMLAQYDAVLPPPGAPPPPGAIPYAAASDAAAAGAGAAATTTTATSATSGNGNNAAAAAAALPPQPPAAGLIALGPSQVALGMDDPEAADFEPGAPRVEDGHLFGWDVEKPAATVNVAACRVQNRPVTVAEYYAFLSSRQQQQQAEEGGDAAAAATRALVPASWTACGASATGWAVRTVFGAVPLEHAWYWPVVCSLLLANAYADSVGMRVPSEGELMLMRREAAARGDLDVHTNNVSFRHWHPTPTDVDSPGKIVDIVGQAWEWTSTPFAPLAPGYSPSVIYPDYSVDFFDGKHNVILGGSWATHHRWAQRACVRNWYQHNYPYVFAKFRLAEK